MSQEDYHISKEIAREFPGDIFYAAVMVAMRVADTDNLRKLQQAFPEVWAELRLRYNAPGGLLIGDDGYEEIHQLRRETGIEA